MILMYSYYILRCTHVCTICIYITCQYKNKWTELNWTGKIESKILRRIIFSPGLGKTVWHHHILFEKISMVRITVSGWSPHAGPHLISKTLFVLCGVRVNNPLAKLNQTNLFAASVFFAWPPGQALWLSNFCWDTGWQCSIKIATMLVP